MINSIAFSLIALCIIYIYHHYLKKVTSEYFILLYLRALYYYHVYQTSTV